MEPAGYFKGIVMSADRVCDRISYKQGAELLSVLVKAGLTPEKAQAIIVAPGNALARIALAAVFDGQMMPTASSKKESRILELLGTSQVVASTEEFVAKHMFLVNTDDDAAVKVEGYCANFSARFLSGGGKIERLFDASSIRTHKLLKKSLNSVIISELGGKVAAETSLYEIWSMLLKQGVGQEGDLLNDGWWNVFFVRDRSGELCTVGVRWGEKGWYLMAGTAKGLGKWGPDVRVFSRLAA